MSQFIANFSKLKGIGPATEARLHSAGVVTWSGLSDILAALGGIRGVSNQALRVLAREAAEQGDESEADPIPSSSTDERTEAFLVKVVLDRDGGMRTHVADARTQEQEGWNGWRPQETIEFIQSRAGLDQSVGPATVQPAESSRSSHHHVLDAGKVVGGAPRRIDVTVDTDVIGMPGHAEVEYRAVLTGRPYGQPDGGRRSVGVLSGRAHPPEALELRFDTAPLPEGLIQLELEIDVRSLEEASPESLPLVAAARAG